MEGDDRTYSVKFTNEGVLRLQKEVEEKLKEFLGYTDETLVEYVIVLLKNGRRKDGAKNELHVFLGDDSDSFVTWLWDHLGSHLSRYVQSPELQEDGTAKMKTVEKEPNGRSEPRKAGVINTKSAAKELAVRSKPRQDGTTKTEMASREPVGRTVSHRSESEAERKPSRNRHSRDWKGLVKDDQENEVQLPPSSPIVHVNNKHDPHRRDGNTSKHGPHRRDGNTSRLLSPRRRNQKNKRISEEREPRKRDIPQIPVGGARRLLQFAVRDAVKPSNTSTEPSLKRLRSVVTTTIGGSFHEELSHRNRSTAGLHADMSAAIKAAAEAVKDVSDIRYPHNIFDRLGYAGDIVDMINNEEDSGRFAEGEVVGILSDEREDIHSPYHEEHGINLPHVIMSNGDIIASDLVYGDIELRGQGVLGMSDVNWVDDSLALPLVEAHDFDERELMSYNDLDEPTDAYHSSRKVASSVNMEAWSMSEDVRDVYVTDHGKLTQDGHTAAASSEAWLVKENHNPVIAVDGDAKHVTTGPGHESQKTRPPAGLYSTGSPVDNADVRSIYVSNVHYGATDDSLSRHFNKFGEVLKVDILTDPATGQPKGSAYIEFMRKEAAENSLSLNGTSFMSRILKVVRKSSAQPEAAPATTWPARAARATSYPVPRFGRAHYSRGSTSCLHRPRGPVKPGRSFQWKREAQITGTEVPGQASNSFAPRPFTRHLTYVRGES